ncbi:hypothetical protein [Gluconacetobacter tumulicola]|uniref:Uncharacterized protein n=1 Tax=Gluconacetobacter tumulicola TaxID=1017177 RepID=A0A7W4JHN6_9PROT|nr:hypothetical protein [Gluconacetobacter tumulicola]MBB2181232.1 hypothetical protein [Gluconacetobacter tumulicola]
MNKAQLSLSLVSICIVVGLGAFTPTYPPLLTSCIEWGSVADWASALGSLLAVIVACIAAMWAKRASDRTEEISKRSVDVDEFSVANDILKKLCEDTSASLRKIKCDDMTRRDLMSEYVTFSKRVKMIYQSFHILLNVENNKDRLLYIISSYIDLDVYIEISDKTFQNRLVYAKLDTREKNIYDYLNATYKEIHMMITEIENGQT